MCESFIINKIGCSVSIRVCCRSLSFWCRRGKKTNFKSYRIEMQKAKLDCIACEIAMAQSAQAHTCIYLYIAIKHIFIQDSQHETAAAAASYSKHWHGVRTKSIYKMQSLKFLIWQYLDEKRMSQNHFLQQLVNLIDFEIQVSQYLNSHTFAYDARCKFQKKDREKCVKFKCKNTYNIVPNEMRRPMHMSVCAITLCGRFNVRVSKYNIII